MFKNAVIFVSLFLALFLLYGFWPQLTVIGKKSNQSVYFSLGINVSFLKSDIATTSPLSKERVEIKHTHYCAYS